MIRVKVAWPAQRHFEVVVVRSMVRPRKVHLAPGTKAGFGMTFCNSATVMGHATAVDVETLDECPECVRFIPRSIGSIHNLLAFVDSPLPEVQLVEELENEAIARASEPNLPHLLLRAAAAIREGAA